MKQKSLEEEIDELEALDRWRVKSAEVRDQGRTSLRKVKQAQGDDEGWHTKNAWPGQPTVVKALCDRREGIPKEMVEKITRLTATEIFSDDTLKDATRLSVLWAARSMQALAAAPDSSFTEALLTFYYLVVRELYTADAPDWRIGGARAAEGGRASAYMTGECVRAILSFTRTLKNTGAFIAEVRFLLQRREQLKRPEYPDKWREMEQQRLVHDFYASVAPLLDNLAFEVDLQKPRTGDPGDPRRNQPRLLQPDAVEEFLAHAAENIRKAVEVTASHFEKVEKKVRERRAGEPKLSDSDRKRFERSETGHAVALGAIEQGREHADNAVKIFAKHETDHDRALDELAKEFDQVGERVLRLIRPAQSFLASILDQELTAATSEARPGWDPAELAFAAASYGYAANSWDDDRLRRAGVCLAEELSERGRFRSGRPIFSDDVGNHEDVLGAEALKAFAQLLENVESIPIDERLVKSMVLFFDDTRRKFKKQDHVYWCPEQVQEPPKAVPGITAISVLALDRINRMLDTRINARVFQHFSVKTLEDLRRGLSLRDLLQTDYGLRQPKNVPAGEEHQDWREEETIGLTLERMRAHVLDLSRRDKMKEPLFSLILHGPPGTGKTTFVEALAKSARVPLVEITPSDIVTSGAEAVERRARAVFKALALLTRVVILFDEFDPVLKRRDPDAPGPSTVFSFVTPGMLPKLKTLHDMAKKRSVAYTLITNLIGSLDAAAIRSGRFDRKLGVYPPDPLSRQGGFVDQLLSFQRKTGFQMPADFDTRVYRVIQKTARAPLGFITQRGWFLQPSDKDSMREETPFHHVIENSPLEVKSFDSEARPESPPPTRQVTEPSEAAIREYRQWSWIQNWDERIKGASQEALRNELENPKAEFLQGPSRPPAELRFSMGPNSPEGLPSVLIQFLAENGNGKHNGTGTKGGGKEKRASRPAGRGKGGSAEVR